MHRLACSVALSLALVGCEREEDPVVPADTDASWPEPGELRAGVARTRMPVPVGIGTSGYGPSPSVNNRSPFSQIYPATQSIFGHPDMRAIAVSRGEGNEVVFLRIDAIGVFAQLRQDIVERASEVIGRDMDDVLILGATHTHAGPGRVLNTGVDEASFYDIIADSFFPEFYDRFLDAAVGTIEAAMDDLAPARLGTTVGSCESAHRDRRCEDGTYTNPAVPMLVIEREGQIDAVLAAYAVHSVAFGLSDLHLSRDVAGALEQALEDRFDHPVMALYYNSWGADMTWGSPDLPSRPWANLSNTYDRLMRVGDVFADDAFAAIEAGPVWHDEPTVRARVYRTALGREALGYEPGEFEYEFGAVYCGLTRESVCDGTEPMLDFADVCVPFPEALPAPLQTDLTVGRIGDLALVTFPGEPGTKLAEKVMEGVLAADPDARDAIFLGYTQDYIGYSILEDDWWLGGYEASGALWGPRQGEHLSDEAIRIFRAFMGLEDWDDGLPALVPFPYEVATSYQPEVALDVGDVVIEAEPTYGPTDAVIFAVNGEDPWLEAPMAWLETAEGDPVLRPGGQPVNSDDMLLSWHLSVDPPYEREGSTIRRESRTFTWEARLPVRWGFEGGWALAEGNYQIRVELPRGDGSVLEVTSEPFEVIGED